MSLTNSINGIPNTYYSKGFPKVPNRRWPTNYAVFFKLIGNSQVFGAFIIT